MNAKVNINYYGMLLLIKRLEQCGFTKQELQRIAERLKTETGADLIDPRGESSLKSNKFAEIPF